MKGTGRKEKGKGGKGKASSSSWNHVSVTVITSLQNYNSIISQLLNHIQVAFAALATALRRTIFCRRKCVDQTHASAGGDVIKPGGFIRSSIFERRQEGSSMSISRCAVDTNITTESATYFNVFLNIVLVSNVNNRCIQLFRFNTKTALKSVK